MGMRPKLLLWTGLPQKGLESLELARGALPGQEQLHRACSDSAEGGQKLRSHCRAPSFPLPASLMPQHSPPMLAQLRASPQQALPVGDQNENYRVIK